MKPSRILASLGLAVLLTICLNSCATGVSVEQQTPEWIAQNTTFDADPYTRSKKIQTPRFYTGKHMLGRYFLRALIGDAGTVEAYQLYVYDRRSYRDGWAFFQRANDINGTPLPLLKLASEVEKGSGGWTQEHVAIQLDRAYLEKSVEAGMNIRIDGTRDSLVVKVTPVQVAGFLMKVDQVIGGTSKTE